MEKINPNVERLIIVPNGFEIKNDLLKVYLNKKMIFFNFVSV